MGMSKIDQAEWNRNKRSEELRQCRKILEIVLWKKDFVGLIHPKIPHELVVPVWLFRLEMEQFQHKLNNEGISQNDIKRILLEMIDTLFV